MGTEINEKLLARCGLTEEELRVARYFYDLSSAGKRTKFWAEGLSSKKFMDLATSMLIKVRTYVRSMG